MSFTYEKKVGRPTHNFECKSHGCGGYVIFCTLCGTVSVLVTKTGRTLACEVPAECGKDAVMPLSGAVEHKDEKSK